MLQNAGTSVSQKQQPKQGVLTVCAWEPSTASCASLRPACDCARSRVYKHDPDPVSPPATTVAVKGPIYTYVAVSRMPATWLRGLEHTKSCLVHSRTHLADCRQIAIRPQPEQRNPATATAAKAGVHTVCAWVPSATSCASLRPCTIQMISHKSMPQVHEYVHVMNCRDSRKTRYGPKAWCYT